MPLDLSKSLEQLMAKSVGPDDARRILGPLFGIYELRQGDAHLPSEQFDGSFHLVGVDTTSQFVHQGLQLLDACVSTIHEIAAALKS